MVCLLWILTDFALTILSIISSLLHLYQDAQGYIDFLLKKRQAEDTSDNKVLDPSHQNGQIKDKSREAGTCSNGEGYDTDQESSVSLESLSPSCYELEDVEENEFEYIEVEDKIESFPGAIGFAILRRKN